jgi:hypothetical protein
MSNSILSHWKYSAAVSEERRSRLEDAGSFSELIQRAAADARNITVQIKTGRAESLKDCHQPVFLVELPETADALFNGPFGYRAQYWESPGNGLAANCALIQALKRKLLRAFEEVKNDVAMDADAALMPSPPSSGFWKTGR